MNQLEQGSSHGITPDFYTINKRGNTVKEKILESKTQIKKKLIQLTEAIEEIM